MDVICCTDNNFVMPCGVMLKSLCVNNQADSIHIYIVIDASVTEENQNKIRNVVEEGEKGLHHVSFILVNDKIIENYPSIGKVNPHVSKATYYRLLMADYLPQNIDKILYLDCDMIIEKSLRELWNVDLKDKAIAGVIDQCDRAINNYNRLRYSPAEHYVNAGMLLINLSYWREKCLSKVFLDYMTNNAERIRFHDQDVINAVLYNKKILLPLKYNVQTSFYHKIDFVEFDYWEVAKELELAIKNPVILHYSSGLKPWYQGCMHPMRNRFIEYKKMTPWAKQPLHKRPMKFKTKIKCFLENIGFICKEPVLYRENLS